MTEMLQCVIRLWPVFVGGALSTFIGVAILLRVVMGTSKAQVAEHQRLNAFLAQTGTHEQLDSLLQSGPKVACELVRADFILLYLQDSPEGVLVLKTCFPDGALRKVPEYVAEPRWPRPSVGDVFTSRGCDLELLDMAADQRLYSLLVAPVAAWHEVLGFLIYGWRGRRIPDEAARVCMGTGQYLGIALERVGMLETMRAEAQESRRTASQLRLLTKDQSETLHDILHDIRHPLSMTTGYLDILLEDPEDVDQALLVRALRTARSGVQRALELGEDLLRVELPERERIQIHPVAVGAVVAEVAEHLAAYAEQQGVSTEVDIEEDLPHARADERLLYRAISNLALNAVRHTSAGGKISLKARSGGIGLVRVEVSDTGAGIAPDKLAALLSAPLDGRPPHGHLGLHIVRRLVAQTGGELQGASELGKGTTFGFDLVVPSWIGDRGQVDGTRGDGSGTGAGVQL